MNSAPSPHQASFQPIELRRLSERALLVRFSDGANFEISSEILRKNCPCASCMERRGDTGHSNPLGGKPSLLKVIEHTKEEEIRLVRIWLVGNYALGIEWGDGHSTGIYTFQKLRELGEK